MTERQTSSGSDSSSHQQRICDAPEISAVQTEQDASEEEDVPDVHPESDLLRELREMKEREAESLQQRIARLESELAAANAKAEVLMMDGEILVREKAALAAEVHQKEKAVEEHSRREKAAVEETQKQIAQLKALNEKLEKQQGRNLETTKQLQALANAKLALEKQNEQLRLEACKATTDLNAKQKKISSLTEEMAKLRLQKAAPETRPEAKQERKTEDNTQLVKNLLALVENLRKQKTQLQSAVL